MSHLKRVRRIALIVLLSLCFMVSGISGSAEDLKTNERRWKSANELIKERGFLNGIQMPTPRPSSSGNDISYSQRFNANCIFDIDLWDEFFTNSKAMGFDICKSWITWQKGGIQFDSDFKVIGVTPGYLENLEKILKLAEERGLYFCPTLITHDEIAYNQQATQYNYDRMSQFIYKAEYRNLFINNWLKPVLELLSKYPCVNMVDIYCEPEADAGRWNLTRGTNWDKMREFIFEVNKAIKKYDSRLVTYCSASCSPEDLGNLYDGLGLNFYAYDYYSELGMAHDPAEQFLNMPLIYGEVGINNGINNEEYASLFYNNLLTSCEQNGIKAAFYWQYQPKSGTLWRLTDDNGTGRLRSSTLAIRSWAWDREKKIAKSEDALDKPALMYSNAKYIRWYGSRNSTKQTLQRSTDKSKWSEVVSFNPEQANKYEFCAFMYQYTDDTMTEGIPYYYRVVAEGEDGKIAVSDCSSAIVKKREICTEGENLIIGGSGFDNFNNYVNSDPTQGWVVRSRNYELITDGIEGDTTYSGKCSIHNPSYMYQDITLKPYTTYTFTFHYKYNNAFGYWNQFFGIASRWPTAKFYDTFAYFGDIMKAIQVDLNMRNGQWHRYTTTFNSGDTTKVRVMFDTYYTAKDKVDWYLDGVYLFENPNS